MHCQKTQDYKFIRQAAQGPSACFAIRCPDAADRGCDPFVARRWKYEQLLKLVELLGDFTLDEAMGRIR